jgi:hypothetical protein
VSRWRRGGRVRALCLVAVLDGETDFDVLAGESMAAHRSTSKRSWRSTDTRPRRTDKIIRRAR